MYLSIHTYIIDIYAFASTRSVESQRAFALIAATFFFFFDDEECSGLGGIAVQIGAGCRFHEDFHAAVVRDREEAADPEDGELLEREIGLLQQEEAAAARGERGLRRDAVPRRRRTEVWEDDGFALRDFPNHSPHLQAVGASRVKHFALILSCVRRDSDCRFRVGITGISNDFVLELDCAFTIHDY